ncbi:gamma-glutamyl-gamma-aminobutyrate hydrolase family protein [Salinibacter altiplanensis]|uniref:gamma-glutamyl-gamma-aminobutyrate hydrolase family protein n=1 Tax=Salinibacter altiplanensis TaxID=1803181 RepID=UPI000C9EE095|nr:gamma-glutamyl-gamma-aminobutyrate hydrolase family protein [Salinibacter altiplanensis]
MAAHIGITTSHADGAQRLDRRYTTAIEDAGGVPMPVPLTESDRTVEATLGCIDGLVVPGGPAVTEGLTGPLPEELDALSPLRATSDRRWIEACAQAGRPILGICYGMQRLNALAGGTIYGDVEAERDGAQTHSQKRGGTTHSVSLQPSSHLRRWLSTETLTVNTRHLQAIATVGKGFSVAATAPDGVVEAIEHENGRLFGVQFHPERMGSVTHPLFQSFLDRVRGASVPSSA